MGFRARVHNGRLVLNEPTTLPEGTELELSPADGGDELDDAERERLHASLERGLADAKAGRTIPASELVAELTRKK